MSTLELCEKFFDTRDIYKLLELNKDAEAKDIKKAYYKLSLQVHPDRVAEAQKETATEKFKVLSKIYQVLSDKDKRALYDEQGIIDDDDMESKSTSWLDLWRKLFKPLTEEDVANHHREYMDSDLERRDIKKSYLAGSGCINRMMQEVPFMTVEDEPRIQKIVRKMIDDGEVTEYKQFTEEPARKRRRRHEKYARESKEVEEIKAMRRAKNISNGDDEEESNGTTASLESQIALRRQAREASFDNLIDRLAAKYGGDEKKKKKHKVNTKADKVKTGRVQKKKN